MHMVKHFITITKHRHLVIKNCFRAGIGFFGLFHDLSKYSPTEFFVSARLYQGNRSPNEKARELYGYSEAWMHHKGRNKHHFEYWTDIDVATKLYVPVAMPDRYIIEMACDRIAASKVYKKENYTDSAPYDYFMNGHDKDIMHEETARKLKLLLSILKERGENELFAFIRANKKHIPENSDKQPIKN